MNQSIHKIVGKKHGKMVNLSVEESKVTNASTDIEMTTVAQNSELPPPYTERVDTVQPVTNQPIVLQTVIIPLTLKRTPVYVNCPNCNERILTTVQHTNTQKTHMIAGFVCGLTL